MPAPKITRRALRDLDDIWFYIGQNNVAAADRTVAALQAQAQMLADHPGLGPARDDLKPGLRTFPVGSYLILYRVIGDTIEVLRIAHGARNLIDLLDG